MNKKTLFATAGLIAASLAGWPAGAQALNSNDTSLAASDASARDADLADRVRRSVVTDRNLSSYAAKIKISSVEGNVHLTGLVQNEGEKEQIALKAARVAGQSHVVNDLRVMLNVADGSGLRDLLQKASEPRPAVVAAN